MIIIKDKEHLNQLKQRVENMSVKPRIRFLSIGRYTVQSETDAQTWYQVACGRMPNGDKYVSCSCRAGKVDRECKHAALACLYHIAIMSSRVAKPATPMMMISNHELASSMVM